MWKKVKDKRSKDLFNLCYYHDDFLIVEIYRPNSRNHLFLTDKVKRNKYVAIITSYPYNPSGKIILDNDLEVIKLRSLIIAKDIGWSIKNIN